MKKPFEFWLEGTRQELIDFYFEGNSLDVDMLTRIERFCAKAYIAGWNRGFDIGIEVGEK